MAITSMAFFLFGCLCEKRSTCVLRCIFFFDVLTINVIDIYCLKHKSIISVFYFIFIGNNKSIFKMYEKRTPLQDTQNVYTHKHRDNIELKAKLGS